MQFEKTCHFKTLKPLKVGLPFGNYFFCKRFIIGEPFEGVHFDWNKAELLINEVIKHYGSNAKIAYIVNRINHYSIDPQNWLKIEKKYDFLVAGAIVYYNNANYINASLEKQFTTKSIKRCLSIDEAIAWVEQLKEFR